MAWLITCNLWKVRSTFWWIVQEPVIIQQVLPYELWLCSIKSWRVKCGKKIWKNMDVKIKKIPTRGMLRKKFLQIPAAKKILTRKNLPNHPLPLTHKMVCLQVTFWNIIQTLCRPRVRAWCTSHEVWESRFDFVVVYLKAKQEQFIRNLAKNYGNHLKTDARTD